MSIHPKKNHKRDHYNSEQYLYDLISVIQDPDTRAKMSALMESVSDDEFQSADAKYRGRKYPQKSLQFYMAGRDLHYVIELDGDAFRILHYMATYMSQSNLCIAPTKKISDILGIPVRNVERALSQLKESTAIRDTGRRHHRSVVYEVDQDYLSYGVRPQGFSIVQDRYVPVIEKIYVSSGDPDNPLVYYIGDIQEIQPANVVGFNKPKAIKEASDPITVDQLLEGLI